ncbi:hypothetical protein [Methylibium petroleiphilum]|uniref:hypothetical protein n=1 Tax=Methylibium petroleiphilum TaxID=105560 RepID=UPI001ACBD7AA|nr:hypothetical protein [Methylibium petroleiphilum]MBN9205323.1 hypothetical protein [Methylibium petroleiphilum]
MPTNDRERAQAEALEQAYQLALELLELLDEARAAMVRPPPLPAAAAGRADNPARPAAPG